MACWFRDSDRGKAGEAKPQVDLPSLSAATSFPPVPWETAVHLFQQEIGYWGKGDTRSENVSHERIFCVEAVVINFHTDVIYLLFNYPAWKPRG